MGEILIYSGIALIAGWIGWHARGIIIIHNISQNPERIIKLLEEIKKINEEEDSGLAVSDRSKLGAIEVTTEQVGSVYYAYSKDDNQFLGQGTSVEAALKMANERWPNKKFWHNQSEQSNQTA